jgi:hypothetical protein
MNTTSPRSLANTITSYRVSRVRALALALTLVSAGCIIGLTALTANGTVSQAQPVLKALLVVSFVALAVVDFKASVAIAIFELVLAGTGGQWAFIRGGLSGRTFLDAVVAVRALAIIASDWRRTRRLELGRYGIHALVVATVIPIVWMALGLHYGNVRSDIFADGNGFFFFAFIVVIVALLLRGQGEWFRRLFLAACAVNGIVTLVLIFISSTGMVALDTTMATVLLNRLGMGGVIGHQGYGGTGTGAYRLFVGSSLFLQVGLVLIIWRLVTRPRQVWPWLLYAILSIDLLATYTRGIWIAGAAAVVMAVALASPSLKRAALFALATVALWGLIAAGGALNNFSLRSYVFNRSASIVSTNTNINTNPGSTTKVPGKPTTGDAYGVVSNAMRIREAKILFRLIRKRPVLGYGFGAVAKAYGPTYAFELSFLALLFKAGIIGFLIYISFPLRLLWDSWRIRFQKRPPPSGVSFRAASIPFAIVASIMLAAAVDPYLFAAFGIISILAATAWLDNTKPAATPAEP